MRRGKYGASDIKLSLPYQPPYLWDKLLEFLEYRAIPGVETVKNDIYYRTVALKDTRGQEAQGWISVAHNAAKQELDITLSSGLEPVLPQAVARIENMFDLHCDPQTVAAALRPAMGNNYFLEGLRLPGCFDPFEMALRAILNQQISVKAAITLAGRITRACARTIATPDPELSHISPHPAYFLELDANLENALGSHGIPRSRAAAIGALAKSLAAGNIGFDKNWNPEEVLKKLQHIKGIGPWTANYIVMRAMPWADAFLESDVGVKKALPGINPKELRAMADKWRPWRSYAVICLWTNGKPPEIITDPAPG